MRCKFCFATFKDVKKSILPEGHLPEKESIEVVRQLAEIGFEKITFAGGEPTLCRWLPKLIQTAKEAGMTTMIVTNGTNLTDKFLGENRAYLDWIALSVDSIVDATNLETGRAISGKRPLTFENYKEIVDRIKSFGYRIKINTVVSATNYQENLSDLIAYIAPERWKIFQVLPITGQNDKHIEDLSVSTQKFFDFVDRHSALESVTRIVPEANSDMKGSYAMVDPAGRFYDNAEGTHNYSLPILEIGARLAIQQVNYDFNKFVKRDGIYDWSSIDEFPSKITISGFVASGKTTIGVKIAEKMNYQFLSIGNKTRQYVKEHGITIDQFQAECLKNPSLDLEIDQRFAQECNADERLVIDYRLGFKFVKNAFHIFLKIDENLAVQRLRKQQREDETADTVKFRNDTFKQQFLNSYGVDYTAPRNFDLVVNVGEFSSADAIVDFILHEMAKRMR
jgi:radical S-adenosyl methionine domain-containing protein 2